jgi:hypothetical protein
MPPVFRELEAVTVLAPYTTNLSKAQGMIPETFELLELWEPAMSVLDLKARVRETGALGRATQVRVDDIVGRAFAQRFLAGNGPPALYLRRMLQHRVPRGVLRQVILIYTARANRILHDFVREVYWTKHESGAGEVGKQDAREFIERAISRGDVQPRWSDTMIERVTRYLLGTLVDFELITANAFGQRQIRPIFVAPETVVYLAYELHQSGADDQELVRHPDWGLLGLSQANVISSLENAATQGHLFIQHSGALVRMEWKYARMEDMIDALAR